MTKDQKKRIALRKEFTDWRKGKGLSYQAIVDTVNVAAVKAGLCLAENPVIKYPAVVSWGTRGSVPCAEAAKALALIYRDCPLLRGVIVRQ